MDYFLGVFEAQHFFFADFYFVVMVVVVCLPVIVLLQLYLVDVYLFGFVDFVVGCFLNAEMGTFLLFLADFALFFFFGFGC